MLNLTPLPPSLQSRLDVIAQTISKFWEEKRYPHFTNQGTAHSERVIRIIAQLAQELPDSNRLTADETFILSAAAWLYETGMQRPNLRPILEFDNDPASTLSVARLRHLFVTE